MIRLDCFYSHKLLQSTSLTSIPCNTQVLYEDENVNRLVEALNLFEQICTSRWYDISSEVTSFSFVTFPAHLYTSAHLHFKVQDLTFWLGADIWYLPGSAILQSFFFWTSVTCSRTKSAKRLWQCAFRSTQGPLYLRSIYLSFYLSVYLPT